MHYFWRDTVKIDHDDINPNPGVHHQQAFLIDIGSTIGPSLLTWNAKCI